MKKLLLFGCVAIFSITFFSCTTDDNHETANMGTSLAGPGDQPIIVPPPPTKKQAKVVEGPGDEPINVPPPKKKSVVSKGPGDAPITVPPPPPTKN